MHPHSLTHTIPPNNNNNNEITSFIFPLSLIINCCLDFYEINTTERRTNERTATTKKKENENENL